MGTLAELSMLMIVIGCTAGLFLWTLLLINIRHARWLIGIMLFASSIGVAVTWLNLIYGSWLLPVQSRRSTIFLGVGTILLFGILIQFHRIPLHRISRQGFMLLLIGLYQGIMRGYHDSPTDGVMSIFFTLATILPVILVIPSILRDEEDWLSMLRVIMWTNLIWLSAVFIQIILNSSKITMGPDHRFIGICSNPQYAAMCLSTFAVVSIWLILHDSKRFYRWLWISLFGINMVLLLGTGSRTGFGMCIIGLMAVLYRRVGKTIILLPFALLATYAAYKLVLSLDIIFSYERVLSLQDTRSASWSQLYKEAMLNPIFGTGVAETGASENSFLYGFAAYGMPFLAIILLFLFVSIMHCFNLLRLGMQNAYCRPYTDLFIGFNMMYFAGSMLEGFILARATIMLMFMLIICTLSSALLHAVREEEFITIDNFDDTGDSNDVLLEIPALDPLTSTP